MLITRRREGESLLIGDDIEVVVLEVSAGRVKLGVNAPREVPVERKEVRLISEANQSASRSGTSEFVKRLLGAGIGLPEQPMERP